jgi:hypothetical protein
MFLDQIDAPRDVSSDLCRLTSIKHRCARLGCAGQEAATDPPGGRSRIMSGSFRQ